MSNRDAAALRKRRDNKRGKSAGLGAIKLAERSEGAVLSPLGALSNPCLETGSAPPSSAAHQRNGDQASTRLQHQLSAENSAEWVGAHVRLTASPGKAKRVAKSPASQALDAVDAALEAAAGQLVQKALKFISIDDGPRKGPSPPRLSAEPQFRFDSSFLDKGLDAINGVGKMMEGFAVTLDSVIGQAFQGAPSKAGDECGAAKEAGPQQHASRSITATSAAAAEPQQEQRRHHLSPERPTSAPLANAWEDFDVENKQNGSESSLARTSHQQGERRSSLGSAGSLQPPALDLASKEEAHQWRRRAQVLQRELQKLKAQEVEHRLLKEQYVELQSSLHDSSTAFSQLCANSQLRLAPEPDDPLAQEQVKLQMEALLREKARLAQENDRLLRENTGLQELLDFTMMQHEDAAGEDDFGEDDGRGLWEDEGEGSRLGRNEDQG